MFGGAGIYADGVMFPLLADDILYFKADAAPARAFQEERM
jgi:DNA transformation protein